jgi:hypothetical protein
VRRDEKNKTECGATDKKEKKRIKENFVGGWFIQGL